MTVIMHDSYGYNSQGVKKFLINRFLRIYPSYYLVITFSLLLLFVFGDVITEFKSGIARLQTLEDILRHVFLILSNATAMTKLSPPSWALTVELFFYICISAGLSRTRVITTWWFCISILITIYLLFTVDSWVDRYAPVTAGSLPFSVGAMLYYWKDQIYSQLRKFGIYQPLLWVSLICLNFCLSYIVEMRLGYSMIFLSGFYLNVLLMTCCIVSLIFQRVDLWKKADHFIGKFSYPIYLIHWQCGALVYALSGGALTIRYFTIQGLEFLVISLAITLLVSFLIITFIENPVQRIRSYIKKTTN